MVTFTTPPASPTTSMLPISAWAFCMFACIASACFISSLMLPRMRALTCQALRAGMGKESFYRTHAVGQHGRAEALAQALHARVGLECTPRGSQLLLGDAPLRLRRRLGERTPDLKLEPHRLAVVARQRLCELLFLRRRTHRLGARIERQTHDCALAADERAVAGELARRARELQRVHDSCPRTGVGGAYRLGRAAGAGGAVGAGSAAGSGRARRRPPPRP